MEKNSRGTLETTNKFYGVSNHSLLHCAWLYLPGWKALFETYWWDVETNHPKPHREVDGCAWEKQRWSWSFKNSLQSGKSCYYIHNAKRYGKEAHSMFSFGICIISLLIYITVNIKARKFEREMLEKRLKEKNK